MIRARRAGLWRNRFITTVFADSSEHAIHAVAVPSRSFQEHDLAINSESVIAALELQKLTLPPVRASSLGPALAVLASPSAPQTELAAHLMTALPTPQSAATPEVITAADKEFGERIAFDTFIPFEQSPLDLESLGELVVSASGVGIGAYAGFVLAGTTPLLLVTIPAGMIICGAAKGVADALEQGLRERLLRFLKGELKLPATSPVDD